MPKKEHDVKKKNTTEIKRNNLTLRINPFEKAIMKNDLVY